MQGRLTSTRTQVLSIKERRRDGERKHGGRQGAPLCRCVMKSHRVG